MLNYEVPPSILLSFVPAGVELDLFDGRVLVSVVGFRFLDTRVLGIPFPGHCNFDEVNLRFYVRRTMPDGEVRRGVTFVRELVPKRLIAAIAKLAYNESYTACPMRSIAPVGDTDSPGRVSFEWKPNGRWLHVAATAVGEATRPAADDEATFITERYWGYTRQRNGVTVEYQVEHPPWRVWQVEAPELGAGTAAFYGPAFEPLLSVSPRSAFLAEGSAVRVFRPAVLDPKLA